MQNPFSDFKTNEMPIEKIEEFFTAPKYIDRIYTPNAMFITGQRGSGKTMFMRYVENNPKIIDDKIDYLGVYYRFDRLIYGSHIFNSMGYDLFLHHLIIALLKQLVNSISSACEKHHKTFDDFQSFTKVITSVFFDYETECNSFSELYCYLEKQRANTMKYVRNATRVMPPIICDYSSCFSNVVEQLHKESWLSDVTLLFLLDEYENINPKQRQAVNGLIKGCSYGYTFKVFHRPAGLDTRVLDSDEHLMVQHDIMVTDFYDEIIGGDAHYPDFMEQMVRKRLHLYYRAKGVPCEGKALDIKEYLIPMSISQEFCEYQKKKKSINKIISSIEKTLGYYDEVAIHFAESLDTDIFRLRLFLSILDKKLSKKSLKSDIEKRQIVADIIQEFETNSKIYSGWVENYKIAILYLLCHENQSRKQTAGWDQILVISQGIARHVINMLHYTFANAIPAEGDVFRRFSPDEQTNAVYTVAEKLYEDIIRVPVVGKAELSLIQYFGVVFQVCHKDSAIKKWEVNHFVINKQNKDDDVIAHPDLVDNILDAAVTWGHLIKRKATKAKRKDEIQADLSEYQLHPLLSVYFGISWRRKQRYDTTYEEVYNAAYGNQERIANFNKTAKKILGSKSQKMSICLESPDIQQIWLDLDSGYLDSD